MSEAKPMTAESLAYIERKHAGQLNHASRDCVLLVAEIRRLEIELTTAYRHQPDCDCDCNSTKEEAGISETSGGEA